MIKHTIDTFFIPLNNAPTHEPENTHWPLFETFEQIALCAPDVGALLQTKPDVQVTGKSVPIGANVGDV